MFTKDPKDKAENKLVLLHLFMKMDYPLTNAEITDFVVSLDLMDYFTLQQYLVELADGGMLEYSKSESDFIYLITTKGIESLDYFKNRLPDGLILLINEGVSNYRKQHAMRTRVGCSHSKLSDSEYVVDLSIMENELTLINLKLSVVSNKQAKEICERWKNTSSDVYGTIIKMLTD
ncbi:MAG: DUF4364 family protein [Peptostreptococcaceae bacterium]|nr:DUF4364 family protein [Peptostreptococcaceae bacterium]